MTLVDLLKKRVETYWAHLKKNDPYHRAIFEGTASREMVATFLVNVRHLVSMTPPHLKLAIEGAKRRGLDKLAAFYELKLQEETGHDQWAADDLQKVLPAKARQTKSTNIDTSMQTYIQKNADLIKKDPSLYLAYVFFAEYFCVIAGPEIVAALEQKCGFPPQSMTVIENHAELDKDHIDEWESMIPQFVDVKSYTPKFMKVLDDTCTMHEHFLYSMGTKTAKAA